MNYCCNEMLAGAGRTLNMVLYIEKFREYGISFSDASMLTIRFCFYCGKELPTSLRSEWFNVLDELIGDDFDGFDDPRVPLEFKTSKWWSDRGL